MPHGDRGRESWSRLSPPGLDRSDQVGASTWSLQAGACLVCQTTHHSTTNMVSDSVHQHVNMQASPAAPYVPCDCVRCNSTQQDVSIVFLHSSS